MSEGVLNRRGLLKWLGLGAVAAPVVATTKIANAAVSASIEKAAETTNGVPFVGQLRVVYEHAPMIFHSGITTVHDPGHSHGWDAVHTHQHQHWNSTGMGVARYQQWDGKQWVERDRRGARLFSER